VSCTLSIEPSQTRPLARRCGHVITLRLSNCAARLLFFHTVNCFALFSSHHFFSLLYPHTLTNRYVASLPRSWHHPGNAQHPIFKNCSSVATAAACDSRVQSAVSRLKPSEVAVIVPSVMELDTPKVVNGCAPVVTVSELSKPRHRTRRLISFL
jgi:hypothetical protein